MERLQIVNESIDLLEAVQNQRRLSLLERAALDALRRAIALHRHVRGSVITAASIARPVAVAQKAAETTGGAACAR